MNVYDNPTLGNSGFDLTDDDVALSFMESYYTATNYVDSIFAMLMSEVRLDFAEDRRYLKASLLLAGFAIELYLKSYLYYKRIPEGEIRTHDLNRLFVLSVNQGLDGSVAQELVNSFQDDHRDHQFRYTTPGRRLYPRSLPALFASFSTLDRGIGMELGEDRYLGFSSTPRWTFPREKDWRLLNLR